MIAIASDHGGFELKAQGEKYLEEHGLEYRDYGCYDDQSCDYPDFGRAAALAVASGEAERGIVICTTGIGVSITANKIRGIRCALCSDELTAKLTRLHNNANMLAMGASIIGPMLAISITDIFLDTEFSGEVRHMRRISKIEGD